VRHIRGAYQKQVLFDSTAEWKRHQIPKKSSKHGALTEALIQISKGTFCKLSVFATSMYTIHSQVYQHWATGLSESFVKNTGKKQVQKKYRRTDTDFDASMMIYQDKICSNFLPHEFENTVFRRISSLQSQLLNLLPHSLCQVETAVFHFCIRKTFCQCLPHSSLEVNQEPNHLGCIGQIRYESSKDLNITNWWSK
jgi:hypothetical protein